MKWWDVWANSAKRTWQRPLLRWTTILTLAIIVGGSALFLWRVIPLRRATGTVVVHYNIYLGIDDIRPLSFVFLLPAVWFGIVLIDFLVAYGSYRHDPHFASSLIFLAFLSTIPCLIGLYYLARMNV